MTVKELIEALEKMSPNMQVVRDVHSEYCVIDSVTLIEGFDNGGYVSHPYRAEDKLRAHGYVYIA